MVINKENIEEYLLLLIDGELSEADEMEVMAFIEDHNEYQVLLDQFMETKLEAEPFVFEDKQRLLKPETQLLQFISHRKMYYRAAAIAAVLCAGIAFRMITTNKVTLSQSVVQQVKMKKAMVDSIPQQPLLVAQHKEQPIKEIVHKRNKPTISSTQNTPVVAMENIRNNRSIEPLETLPDNGYKQLEVATSLDLNASKLQTSDRVYVQSETLATKDLLVDGNRLDGVNALLAQVENIKDNLEAKTKVFKNITVAIRLGGKEFTIGKQN